MNKTTDHLALSAMLAALATLVGTFLYIPLAGGHFYVIAAVLFALPAVLNWKYVLMTAGVSLLLTDLFTGYGAYAWMTLLAYGTGMIMLLLTYRLNLAGSMVLASGAITIVYLMLNLTLFDYAYAIADLSATAIQFAICIPLGIVLFLALEKVGKRNEIR